MAEPPPPTERGDAPKQVPRGGTVRMEAPARDPSRPSRAVEPGERRNSRLSTIRTTLRSMLPPIPKSFAAYGAPTVVLATIASFAIATLVFLAATGRLPEGMNLPFATAAKSVPVDIPPPREVAERVVEVEDFLPSAKPGRSSIGRAVLQVPKTFTAGGDGGFDLVVHFNGNTELVLESYETALLDTVVVVVNLGSGSGLYEDWAQNPENLERIWRRVPEIVEKRGLEHAHIRRVALSGWSAGYGAVVRALFHPATAERVDAAILLDGLHTSYKPGTTEVEGSNIASIVEFARRAQRGEKLLVITHSNIKPDGYLGVRESTDYLLGQLGLSRHAADLDTTIPRLAASKGVLPEADLRPLHLSSEVREGSLIVRGFDGDQAAHHISHLMQMSQLALPALAQRWSRDGQ